MEKTIRVTTTAMIDKTYALSIEPDDRHVDIRTWGYTHEPGNHTDIVFHDMGIADLLQLGQSIMAEAGRLIVEREEK